jgi:hypothetical protein
MVCARTKFGGREDTVNGQTRENTEEEAQKKKMTPSWKEWIEQIVKKIGIEWDGVKTTARPQERWTAACKRSVVPSGTGC